MTSILMFLMQAAPAAAPAAAGGDPMAGSIINMVIMIGGMFAIMYFLIIRPQNNRMKKHNEMLKALKKGDTVITNGGIIGKIFKLADDEVTLDTGEGGKLRLTRQAIGGLYTAATPAPANDAKES
jgi:preprotein translocase subunit YajC